MGVGGVPPENGVSHYVATFFVWFLLEFLGCVLFVCFVLFVCRFLVCFFVLFFVCLSSNHN